MRTRTGSGCSARWAGSTETSDIPDPWGGGPDEFGHVLDLLGAAAPVIAARLARLLETAAR